MLALGLVSSLSRPGGNVTGLSLFVAELTAKRLELIKEAVPSVTRVAILLSAFEADFARVFAAMTDQQVRALMIHEDTMLNANANALAIFAAVRRLPSSGFPEFVRAGGLLAYGINFTIRVRQEFCLFPAGSFTPRVLERSCNCHGIKRYPTR